MKIALDPYMLRDRPFGEVCRIAADIGYDSIELSPRPDFIPFFTHPRADRAKVVALPRWFAPAGAAISIHVEFKLATAQADGVVFDLHSVAHIPDRAHVTAFLVLDTQSLSSVPCYRCSP